MNEEKWIAWEMQTSKQWRDMEDVLKYTNIDSIDYDHKMLVEYALKLNQVIDRSEYGFTLELVEETKVLLDTLYGYAADHFRREEHFMALYELPNDDVHKWEHDRILAMLADALESFNSGKVKLTRRLKVQIMDWLIHHINMIDCEFFKIENWSQNILKASSWNDVKPIIRLTGISEIDNQHQRLTEIALNAMKIISENPSDLNIEVQCNAILDYARLHFEYETEFMKTYNIKETESHLAAHETFLNKIASYAVQMKQEHEQLDTMKNWLLSWWIEHINTVDKKYFEYRNWAYQLIERAEQLEDVSAVLRRTGIEAIDQDHLMLMTLTLKLNKSINKELEQVGITGDSKHVSQEVIEILDETYTLAKAHFEREEKLMEMKCMDDLRSHKSEHEEILEKIRKIKENYLSGRLYLSSNLKTMILEWWILHTNTTDYRTFVQNYVL